MQWTRGFNWMAFLLATFALGLTSCGGDDDGGNGGTGTTGSGPDAPPQFDYNQSQ
jgi:hypothetical protein